MSEKSKNWYNNIFINDLYSCYASLNNDEKYGSRDWNSTPIFFYLCFGNFSKSLVLNISSIWTII